MVRKRGGWTLLGPVFAYEWLIASRRWQIYALRSFFVLMLLSAATLVWARRPIVSGAGAISGLARVGELLFSAVIGTQLTLVLLAAPAATAGALCLDRARGTLTHLLMTDLSDREIVLGKLAARLIPVLGLVGCGLPLLALLTLLGGVDPEALTGAFLVTIGVAILGCTLAFLLSLWASKTHEVLLITYAVWTLWLLGRYMIPPLSGLFNVPLWIPPNASDPYLLAFGPYLSPGSVSWGDYFWFLGATGSISMALAVLAIVRLRAVCTRANVRKTRKGPARRREWFAWLPGPSLDGNPVLWREWHRSKPSRWSRIVSLAFYGLAALFSIMAVFSGSMGLQLFVNGFQVSIGLLLISVSAASALAEERARGSLDVLMATPLSTREIVLGKWWGSFRSVPPLAILPALVVLASSREGPIRAVVMVAYILAAGAAVTSLGLALATWCARLGRAVGLTVALYVIATVGWMFLVIALTTPEPYGLGVISASPFYAAIVLSFDSRQGRLGGSDHWVYVFFVFAWALVYAGVAVWLLVVSLASFDRCLGRVAQRTWTSISRGGRKARATSAALAEVLEAPSKEPLGLPASET